jgi:hypothetical protein
VAVVNTIKTMLSGVSSRAAVRTERGRTWRAARTASVMPATTSSPWPSHPAVSQALVVSHGVHPLEVQS